jgi:hypothetical protein
MGRCVGKMRKAKDYCIEEWNNVFELSPESKSGIIWKISGNNKKKGKPVGWQTELGYWKCEYKNKSILLHRVVYFLTRGTIDSTMVIDHIDRNPDNNKPENLRMISYEENTRNRSISKTNTSGFTGIHERHSFIATWHEDGKPYSKEFSVLTLGNNARKLAEDFRESKIKELNDKGLNYSETHGQ